MYFEIIFRIKIPYFSLHRVFLPFRLGWVSILFFALISHISGISALSFSILRASFIHFRCGSFCFILFSLFTLCTSSWRRAPGKFPLSSHHTSALVLPAALAAVPCLFDYLLWSAVSVAIALHLQSFIGRCSWLTHLWPLYRCVHGIALPACSHIGCYDRSCGDGPWSCFLPYRALSLW